MRKKIIAIGMVLIFFGVLVYNLDNIDRYYGKQLKDLDSSESGKFYSPDRKYYVEIWTVTGFTFHALHDEMPGFAKVYDVKTGHVIYESHIFDLVEQTSVLWPCDESYPFLTLGNEIIMKLPIIKNCYK